MDGLIITPAHPEEKTMEGAPAALEDPLGALTGPSPPQPSKVLSKKENDTTEESSAASATQTSPSPNPAPPTKAEVVPAASEAIPKPTLPTQRKTEDVRKDLGLSPVPSNRSNLFSTPLPTVEKRLVIRGLKIHPLWQPGTIALIPALTIVLWQNPFNTGFLFFNVNLAFLLVTYLTEFLKLTYGEYSLLGLLSNVLLCLLAFNILYASGMLIYKKYLKNQEAGNVFQ